MLKTTLLVSAYNQVDVLPLYLMSLQRQSRLPDELVVADDGSSDHTKELIEEWSKKLPFPVKHIWHPDEGFRLAAIRNKAILASSGDYIIQTDGDLILHPHFIKDHIRLSLPGKFLRGFRCLLSEDYTRKIKMELSPPSPNDCFAHSFKKKYGYHFPWLSLLLRYLPEHHVLGCNMSFFKQDLESVNGYNEALEGWGKEDDEIALRLRNAGIHAGRIMFSGIVYHLFHPENSERTKFKVKEAWCERVKKEKIILSPNGLKKE